MILAQESLKRLQEGNCRFVSGISGNKIVSHHDQCYELTERQEPFAIILGCSDSRAPAEIIFQGLGEFFVIRVAGNIVTPSQVGSVDSAAELFGTRLIVVNHSKCGAILAAIEKLNAHP